jgi:hypothetical protein
MFIFTKKPNLYEKLIFYSHNDVEIEDDEEFEDSW